MAERTGENSRKDRASGIVSVITKGAVVSGSSSGGSLC